MQGDALSQLSLPTVLDFAAAESLLDMLRTAPATARLDASAVTLLTLPCAQIILAAVKTHPAVAVFNPSAAFLAAFDDLALEWRQDGQIDIAAAEPDGAAQTDADAICPIAAMETDEAAMPKRILTIDDSRTIRDMLNLTLSEAGFEVLQAVDGQDGIDVLAKERVDLVITDINMPKMDGYEVIRHMRGRAEHKSTPVLVLTTESELEKRNIAREAGATGWMVKPFDPERLVATINKVAP
jgi:two-component system chemotaxis response regulator CheY